MENDLDFDNPQQEQPREKRLIRNGLKKNHVIKKVIKLPSGTESAVLRVGLLFNLHHPQSG